MIILVLNCGSSSIKYSLFHSNGMKVLCDGLVERIGEETARIKHKSYTETDPKIYEKELPVPDHNEGMMIVTRLLVDSEVGPLDTLEPIGLVGHRVVHGGEQFSCPTIITDEVKDKIQELSPFAPLHNPANLTGINVAMEVLPEAKHVAIFDTAFHQSIEPKIYRYAIPNELYEKYHIRVYGFHGTSHQYVSRKAIEYLGKPVEETRLITAHLGNGASLCAVKAGRSVDTTMGFSPLDGLIMGTRCGDLDPAIIYFMNSQLGLSLSEIDNILNKKSGIKGITGHIDMRDVRALRDQGDANAELALEMYIARIKKHLGAHLAIMGGLDALIFTAGVGENESETRYNVCSGLEELGLSVDKNKNSKRCGDAVMEIQSDNSRVKILVIPTDEELEIASQSLSLIEQNC